jgi:hypothetical protein
MQLIFLYGPPAVGKLTVAIELEKLTGFRLFHNHLTVDLVSSLFAFGSEPFVELREEIWLATFRIAARSGNSLIFTFAPEKTVRPEFIDRSRSAVEENGGEVIFIELTCTEGAILTRLEEPSRMAFTKLNSIDRYHELKAAGAFSYPTLPSSLTLDTTTTSPSQTAQLINEFLKT